jgi:hypothetical protein
LNCVVINDACCLIDLRKGQLLHVLMRLPYKFVVPLPIRADELLDFTPQDWRLLEDGGFTVYDLPGDRVAEVVSLRRQYSYLSAHDCFALVTTNCHENSILLTGDRQLRKVAISRSVRVHGVLWIVDELIAKSACSPDTIISALQVWKDDQAVFLPLQEIEKRLRKLGAI